MKKSHHRKQFPAGSLLERRINLISTCCRIVLVLLGLGAVVARLLKMSPLLPSYPG